jgi:hypothetical protein
MEAWSIYLEEFRRRGEAASRQQFGREALLGEAAHDAYQVTADRMTSEHGWSDEHTLVVLRGMNAAVQQWLSGGGGDWERLGSELQRRETELREGFSAEGGVRPRQQEGPGRG